MQTIQINTAFLIFEVKCQYNKHDVSFLFNRNQKRSQKHKATDIYIYFLSNYLILCHS